MLASTSICAIILSSGLLIDGETPPVAAFMGVRSLPPVELEFVKIVRFAPQTDESPTHSHCRSFVFTHTADGFAMRSKALDPIVTPTIQARDGSILASGQDETVLFDGSIQVVLEDIPESTEDVMRIEPLPSRLKDSDVRKFGLFSIIEGSYQSVEKVAADRYNVIADGTIESVVTIDPESGLAIEIEVLNCSGQPIGRWSFDHYEWVDVDSNGFLFPRRASLSYIDPYTNHITSESIYLLKDVRSARDIRIAERIRAVSVPAATIVRDDRFVPRANYYAGPRGAPPVAFGNLGPQLVEAHEAEESTVVTPNGTSSATTANGIAAGGQWPRMVLWTAVAFLFTGLLRTRHGSTARRTRTRLAVLALMLMMVIGLSRSAWTKPTGSSSLDVSPRELDFGSVELHSAVDGELMLENRGEEELQVRVQESAPWLAVYPKSVKLAPGEKRSVLVQVGVADGIPAIDANLTFDILGADSTAVTIAVRGAIERKPVPTAPTAQPTVAPVDAALVPETLVRDVGRIFDGDVTHASYPMTNRGPTVINVKNVHAECGCTVAKVVPERIEPGATAVLEVDFVPENRVGGISRKILVVTDDPTSPILTFEILADVVPDVLAGPGRVDIGTIGVGAQSEVELELSFPRHPVEVIAVTGHGLNVSQWAVLKESNEKHALMVVIDAPKQDSAIEGEIHIQFAGRQLEQHIKVVGRVRDDVWLTSAIIGFPFIDARHPDATTMEFAVQSMKDVTLAGLDFDASKVVVVPVPAQDGEAARYRVSAAKGIAPGFFSTPISIRLAGREHPLITEVRGFVSERDGLVKRAAVR